MKGFLKNLYLRPSCYHCAARQGKSGADISIADYWGVQTIYPEIDDDKGTGLILIGTEQGTKYYTSVTNQVDCLASNYDKAIMQNPCIVKSVAVPKYRDEFWGLYPKKHIETILPICNKMRLSIMARCINIIKRIIKRLIKL